MSSVAVGHSDVGDVVGVELTIDGVLVVAGQLGLIDFPPVLAVRPNIPFEDLRDSVSQRVRQDLTEQGVLGAGGHPHPALGAMMQILAGADRTLEGRWWRRDAGGVMVRFAICRKGARHVIAVRDGDLLVLQQIAPQVGLAGMVTAVLGSAAPADVAPLTAVANDLAACSTSEQLSELGVDPDSARLYAEITRNPDSWVEITAGQHSSGGTSTTTNVAAGVLDSAYGRLVSSPRLIAGQTYGSFLPGTMDNLQIALDGLLAFVPAGGWYDEDGPHHG